jgi:hypothetical protein
MSRHPNIPVTVESFSHGTTKAAVTFCVPMVTPPRFAWRWRSEDHSEDSTQSFPVFADCVSDAERSGYKVGMNRMDAPPEVASGPVPLFDYERRS